VEGAGEGIHMYPDQHYREWPEPWTKADIEGDYYLKSQSPSEELAGFLVTRGECLSDHGRIEETIECYRWACALAPNDPRYKSLLQQYTNRLCQKSLLVIQYEDEKRRQQKILEMAGRSIGVAGHSRNCECAQCRHIRASAKHMNAPCHSPGCGCALCREARSNITAVVREPTHTKQPGMGHPPMCQCFHCSESRSTAQSIGTPGHPPSCRCFHCQQSRTLPQSRR
jgi:hypothetical protein